MPSKFTIQRVGPTPVPLKTLLPGEHFRYLESAVPMTVIGHSGGLTRFSGICGGGNLIEPSDTMVVKLRILEATLKEV